MLAKTSCRYSMQAFFAGNSLLLRIFFICSTYRKPRSSNMPAIQGCLHLVLGSQGLYPFDVQCVACHISAAFEESSRRSSSATSVSSFLIRTSATSAGVTVTSLISSSISGYVA